MTKHFYSHQGQVFDRQTGESVAIEDVLGQLAAHEDLFRTFLDASKSAITNDEKDAYSEAAECVASVME